VDKHIRRLDADLKKFEAELEQQGTAPRVHTRTHSLTSRFAPETKGKGKGTKASKHKENGKGKKKRSLSFSLLALFHLHILMCAAG
jgi:hypothetical protein